MLPASTVIPVQEAQSLGVIGLRWDNETLVIGVADTLSPDDRTAVQQRVAQAINAPVAALSMPLEIIQETQAIVYTTFGQKIETAAIALSSESDGPIADIVNFVLDQAVRLRASDIHIEPNDKDLAIRIRVDGKLEQLTRYPNSILAPLVSRLKVLAKINIVERRRPQDGQFTVSIGGRDVDVRLATVATLHGEKATLRLLDTKRPLMDLQALGMSRNHFERLMTLINSPYGLVVAAGPTGSGKTTTLHSALHYINTPDRNVTTIEDPVEYVVDGITHIPIIEEIGVGFSTQLRAVLRQDPDVIMVGETRDAETARISVQAALSGRLVLTSLHAPDAVGVLYRLFQMDIESHLVAASLRGVVSQRLVRRVCEFCTSEYNATAAEKEILHQPSDKPLKLRKGLGCTMCRGTGYRDRIGVYQIFEISERMREIISTRPEPGELYAQAVKEGLRSLADEAYDLVLAGKTTMDEAFRLATSDE